MNSVSEAGFFLLNIVYISSECVFSSLEFFFFPEGLMDFLRLLRLIAQEKSEKNFMTNQ